MRCHRSVSSYSQGNGELKLVVDDEENVREITKATLQKFNYRVLIATDGADAIGVFAQHADEVALILTDLAMSFLDGPGMIQAIRHSRSSVTIIAMSRLKNAEQTAELKSLAFASLFPKPFTAKRLLMTLSRTLTAIR
ncbi:MAG: response regulator [Acidobacteriota bacterium]